MPGWYATEFTASEFSNALKPVFLQYLTEFAEKAIYLDCDIAVFSRLTEMIDLMATRDLVLVPHMLTPLPRPEQFWVHPTRADIFNSGLVNAGCFGIRLARCREFLMSWEDANLAAGSLLRGSRIPDRSATPELGARDHARRVHTAGQSLQRRLLEPA